MWEYFVKMTVKKRYMSQLFLLLFRYDFRVIVLHFLLGRESVCGGWLCTQSMYPVCSLNKINISIMYCLIVRSYVFFIFPLLAFLHDTRNAYWCLHPSLVSPLWSTFGTRCTVGSRLATFLFMTIHFYDSCRAAPSIPDLWCITVTTQASFLYLVRF